MPQLRTVVPGTPTSAAKCAAPTAAGTVQPQGRAWGSIAQLLYLHLLHSYLNPRVLLFSSPASSSHAHVFSDSFRLHTHLVQRVLLPSIQVPNAEHLLRHVGRVAQQAEHETR